MAEIVLGIASSHAPQLAMPPDQWRAWGDRSRTQAQHWFNGQTYSFPELVELRSEDHFDQECTDEKFQARFDACQKAIGHLSATLAKVAPDVCIMFGDDQYEAFLDDNMPSIAIYHGSSVDDAPRQDMARSRRIDNEPRQRVSHPTDAELGQYLIESLVASEFDVARTNKLPEGSRGAPSGTPSITSTDA